MKEQLKTVCIFDPGIASRVPYEKLFEWARKRDYKEIEPFIDKADPPTIYHYRRLSRSVMDRYIDSKPSDEGKAVAAFQYGIESIEHLRTEDGARISWEPSGNTNTPDGSIRSLTDQEMDMPELSRAEQIEIGTVIYNASFLPRWSKQGYPVSPLSLSLWVRLDYQSAAVNQPTAPPSNEKRSDTGQSQTEPTGQSNGSSGEVSEPVGAVTALAKTG